MLRRMLYEKDCRQSPEHREGAEDGDADLLGYPFPGMSHALLLVRRDRRIGSSLPSVRRQIIISGHPRRLKPMGRSILPPIALPAEFMGRVYRLTLRRRRALVMTLTELSAIAAAAKMGLSRIPKTG